MSVQIIVILLVVTLSALMIWNIQRKRKNNIVNVKNVEAQRRKQQAIKKSNTVERNSIEQAAPIAELPLNPELDIPKEYTQFKLLTITQTSKASIDKTLASVSNPNPLLLTLAQKTYQANELYELIKSDPEMSALILKEVNSPLYALDKAITSVNHAIVFLGASKIKDIVIQCCMTGTQFVSSDQKLAYNKLWQVSHMASSIAYIIAKLSNHEDPAQLSTSSLLSYLGDQAILSSQPDCASLYLNDKLSSFERVLALQNQYALNSPIIGQALSLQWGLPKSLIKQIHMTLNLLPAHQTFDDCSTQEQQQNIICYISRHLAEAIVLNQNMSIEQLLPVNSYSVIGLHFINLPEALMKCDYQKLNPILNSPAFINQINKLAFS